MKVRTRRRIAAATMMSLLMAGSAQAQTAFRGDCDQAKTFAAKVAFRDAYRGVQRITTASDSCGRDVVAAYNLKLRPGSSADYDMAGRYYYLWPTTGGACAEENYDRLSGTVRITQRVRNVGLLCEVAFVLEFDITADEKYGANKFSKLITLVGADTSRFAATLPTSTEAMVFYEAPVTLTNPASEPDQPILGPGGSSAGDPDGDRDYVPPLRDPRWGRGGPGY